MLKGKNIVLRAVEPQDLELHYQWENDQRFWSVSNTLIPFSRETLRSYLSSIKDIYADKQFRFIIETIEGKAIGLIDLFDFDPTHKRAGIGILIADESERKKGYAKEALELLINYCKKTLNLNNLFCNILSSNLHSIHLFSSKNFKEIGNKLNWHWNGDAYEDEILFQLELKK